MVGTDRKVVVVYCVWDKQWTDPLTFGKRKLIRIFQSSEAAEKFIEEHPNGKYTWTGEVAWKNWNTET